MGRVVIADRYLWDTWIDFKLNFPGCDFDKWLLWKILKVISPKPNHFFLLLIPVEESLRRSQLKEEPFPDPPEILQQRLDYYYRFSKSMGWHVIQCVQPIDDIAREIAETCNC
jgi:dTMP kinase